MGGKKTENTKKAAGNAKKAAVAADKAQAESSKQAAAQDADWASGAKNSAKKEQADAKKAALAAKKAEKDALLQQEEAALKSASKPNAKTAVKKSKGTLSLDALDADAPKAATLNATGIDDALDALTISTTSTADLSIDRHPERRFKAAYAAFEERRLKEAEDTGEMKGLRRQQRIEVVRKEFERSGENPFNQQVGDVVEGGKGRGKVVGRYDMKKEEVREAVGKGREGVERRLVDK